MAERDDKTEQASERRLERAFDEGQIAIGRDVVAFAVALALLGALSSSTARLGTQLCRLVTASMENLGNPHFDRIAILAWPPAFLVLGVLGFAAIAAVLATVAQTRGGFWPDLVGPKLDRLIGGGGVGRLFKRDLYADIGLSAVKLVAMGTAVWLAISGTFLTQHGQLLIEPAVQFRNLFQTLAKLAQWALGAMALTAGTDLAIAHRRFGAKMRMSRQEAKQERREEEGDPLLRSKRRRRHREFAKGRVVVEVPKADVVVVNPTHVAVALRYRRGSDRAPRLVAKGKGVLAELIRDIARNNGIPIVEDIPLARFLHRRVKIGMLIPADTYKAVATILAFAYRLSRGAGAGVAR